MIKNNILTVSKPVKYVYIMNIKYIPYYLSFSIIINLMLNIQKHRLYNNSNCVRKLQKLIDSSYKVNKVFLFRYY
jgi:hypothetical protein